MKLPPTLPVFCNSICVAMYFVNKYFLLVKTLKEVISDTDVKGITNKFLMHMNIMRDRDSKLMCQVNFPPSPLDNWHKLSFMLICLRWQHTIWKFRIFADHEKTYSYICCNTKWPQNHFNTAFNCIMTYN